MPEMVRYLRSISNPKAYEPPVDMEDLLQQGYADRTKEPDAQGIRLLQESLSLYAVPAKIIDGKPKFESGVLEELAILHAASARMGSPNRHFLGFTVHITGIQCLQEDSPSPFLKLRACHHSLKVTAGGHDLPQLIQQVCGPPPLIHDVLKDDLEQLAKSLVAAPLSPEWQGAQALLLPKFNSLERKKQQSSYGFWIRAGLLHRA